MRLRLSHGRKINPCGEQLVVKEAAAKCPPMVKIVQTSLSDAQVQHCVADALATPCIARDPAIYGGEIAKQHRSHRPQGNHVLSTVMLDDDETLRPYTDIGFVSE